ncbi:MAG: hypothetical protein ACLSDQ_08670 [Adlercreutzia equolifaciens]
MVPLFLVSLVVGLAVGVLAGLLGIGGGMLLVPAFKLGYAMDSLMCTATSLFTIIRRRFRARFPIFATRRACRSSAWPRASGAPACRL